MSEECRLCIATGRYMRGGETFVNRHIEHLFGGNSVVLCGRETGENRLRKPVFSRLKAAMNPHDLATAPFHLWRNHRRYSAPFVPYGTGRAALLQFLADEGVDAILAEFGSQAVSLWPVTHAAGLPLFAYFRGRDASKYLRHPARVEGYRRMMPNLAGVFAVSGFLLDNLAAHGLAHPNAHIVPSGTDVQFFQPGTKQSGRMVFVGRFVEKKAPRMALDSFLQLATRYPQARLDMVGQGPELAACKAAAAKSPHAGRVTFHGQRSAQEIRTLLAEGDIFVLHALTGRDGETEGMPSAIQEAMAAGMAILSTRHAGIPLVVCDGDHGVLCDEGDNAGFAAAMDTLLANPARTRAMGVASRQSAEALFDYRKLYARVERVILDSLRDGKRIQGGGHG
ncbi:MAG: glycosyltransferase [Rhodobacteraceae bacterium]|nr:MAG: glycosyltransferase [Paracoccaceae bacterium]